MSEERNIIERSLDVFDRHQRAAGLSTDEVSFVGGFMTCFGILTGRVDIGLAPDTPVLRCSSVFIKSSWTIAARWWWRRNCETEMGLIMFEALQEALMFMEHDDGWQEAWVGPAIAFFFAVAIVGLAWWLK
jgi:hypothetical protein